MNCLLRPRGQPKITACMKYLATKTNSIKVQGMTAENLIALPNL